MDEGAQGPSRRRVPAAVRREQLIDAAVTEFANGGLHGTPVQLIAQRVGVAQPYVFSLFPTKRDLFLAAVDRGFARVNAGLEAAAKSFAAMNAPNTNELTYCADEQDPTQMGLLTWLGIETISLVSHNREVLMLQLQAYAACDDEVIQAHVQRCWAELSAHVQALSGASTDELTVFFGQGMWLMVLTALGVNGLEDLIAGTTTDR